MKNTREVIHTDNVCMREDGKAVVIIDQSLLPGRTEYLELETPEEMYDAIYKLRVRGAPATVSYTHLDVYKRQLPASMICSFF